MAIETGYLSQLGRNYKVSAHFTLGEIASKDGADKVLYDTDLLDMWENVRFLLGGDGGADWNAKEGESGHVLNRPFWKKTVKKSLTEQITGETTVTVTTVVLLIAVKVNVTI